MGVLTLIVMVAGGFVAGLVFVAIIVAAWEFLRQREELEALRRDRATYAATSPLPLALAAQAGALPLARPPGVEPMPTLAPPRREPNWIETRPMVLRCAPAVDDETAPARLREPDLRLD